MSKVWDVLAKGWVGGAIRVFAGALLGYFYLDLVADQKVEVSWDEVNLWVAGALIVAVPLVIAAVNPADFRFGRGSGE